LIDSALGAEKTEKLEAIYSQPGADPLLGETSARWATDRDFRCAVRQVADWRSAHGFPTFVYQFDHPVPGVDKAQHSSELPFVFHYFPKQNQTSVDEALSEAIETYWTSFVKTGVPSDPTLVAWPRYSASTGDYLHFPATSAVPDKQLDLGGPACTVIGIYPQ
jgi:para-nitrobenzyl esterase